ncbi:hypothetical protein J2X85_001633 [Microbacterium trichothecenolyticum]|uniref:FHA domain-containing protein n=1 Tax=Microbacterium trichothecenolyticum TaxID=69370 RepID=UPI002858CA63|nr:FHA domain-containing protein [Microbacterium trichothecenolyticum]MDR7184610.1 hypothetical protein [Microbacterium trichothecenolyticum]
MSEWPRITASVDNHGRGSITVNGTSRTCSAESLAALRVGIIARGVAIANSLHRPVRLDVTEAEQTHALGIRPEGYVQLVDAHGMIPAVDGLAVDEGRCRVCRRLQPVTSSSCIQCRVDEPLRVEVDPNENSGPILWADSPYPVLDDNAEAIDANDSEQATTVDAEPIHQPAPAPILLDDAGVDEDADVDEVELTRITRRATFSPTLRLRVAGNEPIALSGRVAIGRRPLAVDGREPFTIDSPSRQVSRTHATIDVEDGQIIVTDLHSANGVVLDGVDLAPGQPTIVPSGAALFLGDVRVVVASA